MHLIGDGNDGADGRVSSVIDDFVYFGGGYEMNNGRAEQESVDSGVKREITRCFLYSSII